MTKKPTEFTVSNERHTFTLRVGDKVFTTFRRYSRYPGDYAIEEPEVLTVREVTEIVGGKTPSVKVGVFKFDAAGKTIGFGNDRLEPYDAEREAKYKADYQNYLEMSRASQTLSYVQHGKWQTICNDPVKRAALIALLGDDVPALKEAPR